MSQQFVCDSCGQLVSRPAGIAVAEDVRVPMRSANGAVFPVTVSITVKADDADKDICSTCSWQQIDYLRKGTGPLSFTA